MNAINLTSSTWVNPVTNTGILIFVLLLVALFAGCSGHSVRVFNEEGLNEQELATVTMREEGGLFGTSMSFNTVDGQSVKGGFFDKKVDAVKVTPGKHTYEIKFHDQSFSLFDSDQHLIITFAFEAIGGHEYIVHFDIDKTVAERLTFGGRHAGWIEDMSSGENLPMSRPD